ncbi:MAG: hypothetical protein WCG25_08325 [bacterium]
MVNSGLKTFSNVSASFGQILSARIVPTLPKIVLERSISPHNHFCFN